MRVARGCARDVRANGSHPAPTVVPAAGRQLGTRCIGKAGQRPALPERCALRAPAHAMCGPTVCTHGSAGRWPAACRTMHRQAGQRPALPERCALRACARDVRANGHPVRSHVVPAAGRQLAARRIGKAGQRPALPKRCALRTPAHAMCGQRSAPTVVPAAGRQLGRTAHRQSRPAAGATRAMCVAHACARDVRANGLHHGSAGRWPAAWPHSASEKPASGRLYQSDARCARLRTRRAGQRSAPSPHPR